MTMKPKAKHDERARSKLAKKYTSGAVSARSASPVVFAGHRGIQALGHRMATSVKVSHRVKALLKERKTALGLKSVDEVLEHLLGHHGGHGDADGGERAGRKRGREAEEEEENERVPQLF